MNWKQKIYKNSIYAWWFDAKSNFGDALNPWLIEKISDKKVFWNNKPSEDKQTYLCTGSILQKNWAGNEKYVEVWGSGAMYSDKPIPNYKKIHAVRGPLSANLANVNVPYGDPAILLDLFYKSNIELKYDIGIIPHYIDSDNEWIKIKDKQSFVKVINILDPIEKVINEICQCKNILSSTLHGLIAADVYNKPSLWVEFSDKVKGNGFKFHDYLQSINQDYKAIQIRNNSIRVKDLLKCFKKYSISEKMKYKLLEVCPFKQ